MTWRPGLPASPGTDESRLAWVLSFVRQSTQPFTRRTCPSPLRSCARPGTKKEPRRVPRIELPSQPEHLGTAVRHTTTSPSPARPLPARSEMRAPRVALQRPPPDASHSLSVLLPGQSWAPAGSARSSASSASSPGEALPGRGPTRPWLARGPPVVTTALAAAMIMRYANAAPSPRPERPTRRRRPGHREAQTVPSARGTASP